MTKQLRMRGRAFGGKLETLYIEVDDQGVVRVWDDVAGCYTTCHSMSEREQARARVKASRI